MHAILIFVQSPTKSCRQAFSSPVSLFLASIACALARAYCYVAHTTAQWAEYSFSFGEIGLLGFQRAMILVLSGISMI